MSLPDLDATESGVRTGRKFGYATIGEWVALCTALSDRAVRIYCLLRAHAGGDEVEKAWPAQKTLADMLGIKKTDGVGEAIRELVDVGAVEIEVIRTRTGRRNVYVVYEAPPDDYSAGPKDNADYYRIRDKRRSEGVTPQAGVTPKQGVTGNPPGRGHGSPPSRGSEPPVVEVGSKSFSRDKSLEVYTHARDEDQLGVEARGRPDDDAEVLGVHEQDLFGGDQLPVSNGKIKKPAQRDAEFDAFWRIYPKRVGKIDARRAWDRALTRVELGRLMAGAETYVRYIQGDPWRKQFTKDPATWLNKGCWDDELDFGPPSRNGKTIPPRVSATDRAVDEVRTAFRELRESGGQLGLPGGPR